jgi:hypothetical protein
VAKEVEAETTEIRSDNMWNPIKKFFEWCDAWDKRHGHGKYKKKNTEV